MTGPANGANSVSDDEVRDAQRWAERIIRSPTVLTRCCADIAPTPLRWLWPGRIPANKVSIVAGDPGLGKSLLTVDLASRVSTGRPWPDGMPCERGAVAMLSAEDDAADTVVPRLMAAGADLERIHVFEGIQHLNDRHRHYEREATLADFEALVVQARDLGASMIVIDPMSAFLPASIDAHKQAEVRALLRPIAELTQHARIATVFVDHLNKAQGSKAVYRLSGSLGFVAAARAAWGVVRDRNDKARRLMLPIKANLGPDQHGLAYRVVERDGTPAVEWDAGPVETSFDDALAPAPSEREQPQREEAARWLLDRLTPEGVRAGVLEEESKAAGFSWRTVKRAKMQLGIDSRREQFGGQWRWHLPEVTRDA